ncbi:MAG: hypothetical protein JNK33_05445 [Candidatus Doudnabacteria bacterium]|nr:hypothetical protein [Candidatus Doudnabacteria bacterium]
MKVQRIGKAGIRGSVIYTGSGYPVDTYIDNDMYIDTDNGNVYQQLVGSWGTKLFSMMNINIDGGYANSIYNNQINLDGGQA